MYKFAYLFSLTGRVVWSGETAESLLTRLKGKNSTDYAAVQEFITQSSPGNFLSLELGDMVFRTS